MPSISAVKISPQRPDFLPAPFEWIYIPAGEVTLTLNLRDTSTLQVDDLYMAKYPVTNAQYAVYIRETGHKPKYDTYLSSNFNHPLHPVVDILWHEAMLFCEWLSKRTDYAITLPTDAQWQHAAQGDNDRNYPWGDEWDSTRCNTEENRLAHTTLVTQYPRGASPYGVMDMVGNVNEWCLTNYLTRENSLDIVIPADINVEEQRIFKGGHYQTSTLNADVRKYGATPIWFPYATGIRLVTSRQA